MGEGEEREDRGGKNSRRMRRKGSRVKKNGRKRRRKWDTGEKKEWENRWRRKGRRIRKGRCSRRNKACIGKIWAKKVDKRTKGRIWEKGAEEMKMEEGEPITRKISHNMIILSRTVFVWRHTVSTQTRCRSGYHPQLWLLFQHPPPLLFQRPSEDALYMNALNRPSVYIKLKCNGEVTLLGVRHKATGRATCRYC